MTSCQTAVRPLTRCLQIRAKTYQSASAVRAFSTSTSTKDASTAQVSSYTPVTDPLTVTSTSGERKLMKSGVTPIGSRRRRAAIRTSDNVPFEQLPYQCFQEARKILQADREVKLKQIQTERLRISNLVAQDATTINGGEAQKQRRLESMKRHLEYLKIQADINDPMIKKRFEDGEGDMNKPIYRYLADRKWRSYQRLITVQRIKQLGIVPDILPHFEPTAEVRVAFRQRNVQPGEFVDSRVSEVPARLKVQVFDKGERLVSVLVLDSDVPVVDKDGFTSRCHYLAANLPLSPTDTSLPLSKATSDQLILPWLPPFAQKGSPYHRYSVFVLEQEPGMKLDVAGIKMDIQRDSFRFRSFMDKYKVKPVGASVFRSLWDEGTAGVMQRNAIDGADVEFKRKRIAPLKPKQKARGWEARHASDKYKSLRR